MAIGIVPEAIVQPTQLTCFTFEYYIYILGCYCFVCVCISRWIASIWICAAGSCDLVCLTTLSLSISSLSFSFVVYLKNNNWSCIRFVCIWFHRMWCKITFVPLSFSLRLDFYPKPHGPNRLFNQSLVLLLSKLQNHMRCSTFLLSESVFCFASCWTQPLLVCVQLRLQNTVELIDAHMNYNIIANNYDRENGWNKSDHNHHHYHRDWNDETIADNCSIVRNIFRIEIYKDKLRRSIVLLRSEYMTGPGRAEYMVNWCVEAGSCLNVAHFDRTAYLLRRPKSNIFTKWANCLRCNPKVINSHNCIALQFCYKFHSHQNLEIATDSQIYKHNMHIMYAYFLREKNKGHVAHVAEMSIEHRTEWQLHCSTCINIVEWCS